MRSRSGKPIRLTASCQNRDRLLAHPRTGTAPSGQRASPIASGAASRTASETMSCEPTSLLRLSRRDARFTVSPMSVYSLRRDEPTARRPPDRYGYRCRGGSAKGCRHCSRRWPEHLARRLDGVRGFKRIVDRRAEDGKQAVSQKLVHYAVVTVDGVDQDFKHGVEALDGLGRRSTARGCGEAADVDEHDANPPHLAKLGRADRQQLLDHPRRDMLTEEVGHFVAGRRRNERPLEMALDRRSDRTGQQAGCEKDGAACQMIAGAEVGSSVRQPRWRVTEARAKSSTAATAPVNAESAKSSRKVERMMKRK